jgi:hypothetical protein
MHEVEQDWDPHAVAQAVRAKVTPGIDETLRLPGVKPDERHEAKIEWLLTNPFRVPASGDLLAEAADIIRDRLQRDWRGPAGSPRPKRKYRYAINPRADAPMVRAPEVEVLICRLLSATGTTRQYGVTTRGFVFTAAANGFSKEPERIYLSGLSPLLDDLEQCFFEFREGGRVDGGRFYERGAKAFDARSGLVFAHIEVVRSTQNRGM